MCPLKKKEKNKNKILLQGKQTVLDLLIALAYAFICCAKSFTCLKSVQHQKCWITLPASECHLALEEIQSSETWIVGSMEVLLPEDGCSSHGCNGKCEGISFLSGRLEDFLSGLGSSNHSRPKARNPETATPGRPLLVMPRNVFSYRKIVSKVLAKL